LNLRTSELRAVTSASDGDSGGGRCWEAQFPQTSVLKSDAGVFKAKE